MEKNKYKHINPSDIYRDPNEVSSTNSKYILNWGFLVTQNEPLDYVQKIIQLGQYPLIKALTKN